MLKQIPFILAAVIGAAAFGFIATSQGEQINALWMVVAAICTYTIAYRYYSKYIAEKLMKLDPSRETPAVRRTDGLDYVPTNRYVLFGHHFAAIAGAGPLVGPVLAAQMGYLPGMLWILVGVVLAGAVQDFIILFVSMRRDGRSLGELIRSELGTIPGIIALFGAFAIMVLLLAVLALIVVKALVGSPWGTFTVAATMPIAILMGIYTRFIRPGRIWEVSIIGVVLLMLALHFGQAVSENATIGPMLTLTGTQLCWALIIYGFVASVLPVWLLLAPRDYLSTFLKIGAIVALALGIVFVAPKLQMPSLTQFVNGTGPVWKGSMFPWLFITIACGSVSGFHSLISSGTTPKLIANETDARFIGYGSMLMESFVAIMALTSACILEPGIYFTMNSPAAVVGTTAESASEAVTKMGFPVTPELIDQRAAEVGEKTIISRAGGAPTLAVGMAEIFSGAVGGKGLKAFWYHFAILFEALFILTAVDAGTRSGRFMLQDLIGTAVPSFKNTSSWVPSLVSTFLCVGAWGYLLYQGVTDPLGGVNTLWPLFGMSNQMLAAIALILATVVVFKMKRQKYAWIPALPAVWLTICTSWAAVEKIFSDNPAVGFIAHMNKFKAAADAGEVLAPAKSMEQMHQIIFNDRVDAALGVMFACIVVSLVFFGIKACLKAYKAPQWTALEVPPAPVAVTE